jgi:hypothetical protein
MTIENLKNLYEAAAENKYGSTPEFTENGFAIRHVNSNEITYFDSLDIQTSKYHKEGLMDHVALVVSRIGYAVKRNPLAVKIAILHDLGKKYTVKINPRGEVCYYGHEHLSALIAKDLISNGVITMSDEDAKITFAVIDAHLQLKLLKGIALECFVEGFKKLYGIRAYKYLLMLHKADEGISEADLLDFGKMCELEEHIKTGYAIIEGMIAGWDWTKRNQ